MPRRRAVLGAAATGLTATLTGCGALFTDPDRTASPPRTRETPGDGTASRTPSATGTATATDSPTGGVVAVVGSRLSLRPSQRYYNTLVDARVRLRNTGSRSISSVELRLDLRYLDPDDGPRVVTTDYVDRQFGGFGPGDTESVTYDTSFPRDGRADDSDDPDDFDVVGTVRRVGYG